MNYSCLFCPQKVRKSLGLLKKHGVYCDCEVIIVLVKKAGWLLDAWLDTIEEKYLDHGKIQ